MSMTLHFLNVGNGDCTIIQLPDGKLMMVDICNGNDSNPQKTNPILYLQNLGYPAGSRILRYVQTHPDMDHMDGLAALFDLYEVTNFWDTENRKPRPDFSLPYSKGKSEDWDAYQKLRSNALYFYRDLSPITSKGGHPYPYELYVFHPTKQAVQEANRTQEWNNLSYVLLLKEGNFKALIAGDIDDGVWEELYEWASENFKVRQLVSKITVFKVSHHGRRSGYCGADWLNLTQPQEIVISKGSVPGEQSAYGNYYTKVGSERLWLTSQGDVVCHYYSNTDKYSIGYQK